MTFDRETLSKPWLLWEHDPCPEGGWSVAGFDTREAAEAAAKFRHEEAEKRHLEMVQYCEETKSPDPWLRSDNCYDGCVVTPGIVFRLDAEVVDSVKAKPDERLEG